MAEELPKTVYGYTGPVENPDKIIARALTYLTDLLRLNTERLEGMINIAETNRLEIRSLHDVTTHLSNTLSQECNDIKRQLDMLRADVGRIQNKW